MIREEILLPEGEMLLVRQLRDYRQFADLYLPGQVEIHQGEMLIMIEYRRHLINRDISRARFFQDLPVELLSAGN